MENTKNGTIAEVYKNLSADEKISLVNDICINGRVATSTAYAWVNGKRRPSYLYQEMIRKTLSRKFNIKLPTAILFP